MRREMDGDAGREELRRRVREDFAWRAGGEGRGVGRSCGEGIGGGMGERERERDIVCCETQTWSGYYMWTGAQAGNKKR